MAVKVMFFASIREAVGEGELLLDDVGDPRRLSALVSHLRARFDETAGEAIAADNVRVAVNREVVREDVLINPGDEVAFYPPVTGG